MAISICPNVRLYPHMTLPEFKSIFFWEYSHRMLGRSLGVFFLAPFAYFMAKGQIPRPLVPRLLLMFAMGGGQVLHFTFGFPIKKNFQNLDSTVHRACLDGTWSSRAWMRRSL